MKQGGRTRVWSPADIIDFGSTAAVDMALCRLGKANEVRRIWQGLYDLPRIKASVLFPPDYLSVLAAIKRRDGVKMLIDDHSAVYRLGLTKLAPSELVVLASNHVRP
jgi:hypothetical protein